MEISRVQDSFTQISPYIKPLGANLQANQRNVVQELDMDIVIAAEKPSIAKLLSEYMRRTVRPEEIKVSENPDETGSFYIGFDLDHFVLMPNGQIASNDLELLE